MRGRAWRRHQRSRAIARRLGKVRNIFERIDGYWSAPGKLSKQKPIDCSCWMCEEHYERHKQGWRWDGLLPE